MCLGQSRCQSLGPLVDEICTAVTLYSGQFVAQSEFSVVTTLACVSGWWKVVYTTPGATRSVSAARLASHTHSPSFTPYPSGIMRMDLEPVLLMPLRILGPPRLRADIILREDTPRGEPQRKARPGLLLGRHIRGDHEPPESAHKAVEMHQRRAFGGGRVAGPLSPEDREQPVSHGEGP